jgi:hypothetical protein
MTCCTVPGRPLDEGAADIAHDLHGDEGVIIYRRRRIAAQRDFFGGTRAGGKPRFT